ncbi:MAG TPA: hypothetical protein K8V16_07625 [Rubneribacter badeniensis]|uniref:Uncharacterized protein n=1 Tax=Rubneribacter badeniensis TaxID=2070688 RepID=A0A9D3ADK4_9ACTN|nr:hypothetical protein [Rubneribacter badeniensis]
MEVFIVLLAVIRMFASLLGLAVSFLVRAVALVFSLLARLFRFLFGKGADRKALERGDSEVQREGETVDRR